MHPNNLDAGARAAIVNNGLGHAPIDFSPQMRIVPVIEPIPDSLPPVSASNTVEYNEGFKAGIQAALRLMGARHAG